jgi:hypothetical protein
MAHLNVSLDFDSESEKTSGTGWRVIDWLDDGSGTPPEDQRHVNLYSTITIAQSAIEEMFSSDPEVDLYFQLKATSDIVTASSATIDTKKAQLRVADGLDATTVAEPPILDPGSASPGDAFPADADITASDATNAAKLSGKGFVADPPEAWTAGQQFTVGSYAFHWDGTAWMPGAVMDRGAASPGDVFPADPDITASDTLNADKLNGEGFSPDPPEAWTTGQKITIGTFDFSWDGSMWVAGAVP